MTILYLNHKEKDDTFRIPDRIRCDSGMEYEVEDRIRAGGNAVVYSCNSILTGDLYAVKFQLNISPNRLVRFHQEVELLKDIRHDQLIAYIDSGFAPATRTIKKGKEREESSVNLPFVIMPIADRNLKDEVQQNQKPFPYEEYIGQFKGLASALGTLHEKAIHRDIKPENILVKGESWLLSDLGLCKIIDDEICNEVTQENEPVGPRYWMSPESVNRAIGNTDIISKRSDVYQLCAVYWFSLTGRIPLGVVRDSDWNGDPRVFPVLADCLSYDVSRRPADGNELAQRLDEATLP